MATYVADVSPLEAGLISRIQKRDDRAFVELVDRFRPRILRTALRILKEPFAAEDALQETFLNVYRAAGSFRGEALVGTWINRIAVNVCLEILRRNKKHDQRTEDDVSETPGLPEDSRRSPDVLFQRRETRQRVQAALERLGEKHRDVVFLHDLEGYTIREIADQIGCAEGTVKSRLFYGREELKRYLAA